MYHISQLHTEGPRLWQRSWRFVHTPTCVGRCTFHQGCRGCFFYWYAKEIAIFYYIWHWYNGWVTHIFWLLCMLRLYFLVYCYDGWGIHIFRLMCMLLLYFLVYCFKKSNISFFLYVLFMQLYYAWRNFLWFKVNNDDIRMFSSTYTVSYTLLFEG